MAWDSVVMIDCLEQRAGRFEWIKPIVREAEAGRLRIVLSSLVIAETTKIGGVEPESQAQLIRNFLDNDYFDFENAHQWVCEIARDIRRSHSLTTVDAIHVATAVFTRSPILLTNDGDRPKSKRATLLALDNRIPGRDAGSPALRIITPHAYHQILLKQANPLFNEPPKESH